MENYIKYGEKYLSEGDNLLKEENYIQAGEKFWGAVTQFVKAYAQKNGEAHDGYAQLFKVINNIANQKKGVEFNYLFSFANPLHINFYEHWLTRDTICRWWLLSLICMLHTETEKYHKPDTTIFPGEWTEEKTHPILGVGVFGLLTVIGGGAVDAYFSVAQKQRISRKIQNKNRLIHE